MNRILLVSYLVLLVSLTVGCSGIPVDDSTMVHTISPKDVSLGKLMLEPEELPSTINIPILEELTENKDIAKKPQAYSLDDPDEALKLLESWGRIKGYINVFGNAQNDQIILDSCAVFDSVDGAKEAFSYKSGDEEFERSQVERDGGSQFEFSRLDEISIGNETRAFKYGYINSARSSTRIHQAMIHFRAEFVLCMYGRTSLDSGILTDELEKIASKGYEKVMDGITMVNSTTDKSQ
jgi:hypothetical protein